MIPRIGERVQSERRYKLRPGAYAILVRDGTILLTHQNVPRPEVQLPGGGIDLGEQILPALHREIREETGWRASELRRVGAYRRFTFMPEYDLWAEKLCHVYVGRPSLHIGLPTEPHHFAFWTSPIEAMSLIENEGELLFLRQVFGL